MKALDLSLVTFSGLSGQIQLVTTMLYDRYKTFPSAEKVALKSTVSAARKRKYIFFGHL